MAATGSDMQAHGACAMHKAHSRPADKQGRASPDVWPGCAWRGSRCSNGSSSNSLHGRCRCRSVVRNLRRPQGMATSHWLARACAIGCFLSCGADLERCNAGASVRDWRTVDNGGGFGFLGPGRWCSCCRWFVCLECQARPINSNASCSSDRGHARRGPASLMRTNGCACGIPNRMAMRVTFAVPLRFQSQPVGFYSSHNALGIAKEAMQRRPRPGGQPTLSNLRRTRNRIRNVGVQAHAG
eukprot:360666-Chlamydomonas_euryale.AAC.7